MKRLVPALFVLALAAGGGWWWWSSSTRDPGPVPAAEAFVAAWDHGDLASGPVAGAPAGVRERYEALVAGLGLDGPDVTLTAVSEPLEGTATAEVAVRWDLGGNRTWRYTTTARLVRGEQAWQVVFDPALVHPELTHELRLVARRTRPPRADILDAGGRPLVTDRSVVDVGVHPALVEDVAGLVDELREILGISADGLEERIAAVAEDQFVPVITLREADFTAAEPELRALAGIVLRPGELPLAPTSSFARALLGRAGPVTAELVAQYPERYVAGDTAGLSGLQRRYDAQLSGQPGMQVAAVPTEDAATASGEIVLHEVPAEDGTPIAITLDERVQRAADATLAEVTLPSALVATRVSDGHVVAVANGPGTRGLDIATRGRYAPGSTFKVVTTAALLAQGLDPGTVVGCEAEAVVDGRRFTNAGGFALGQVPFHDAFAQSCNTSFVTLAGQLETDALSAAARWFGLGGDHTLGIDVFTGEVPVNEPGTDQAAAAIGQARNLVSPLAMADVAATVARGGHLTPRLVLSPDPDDAVEQRPLDATVATTLQELMRAVVTEGSGGAAREVPGAPVHGKTGTAEYGTGSPPRTHAWFIGYQGDLAFAVLVAETEDSFGGSVAAPLAADFLTRLAE